MLSNSKSQLTHLGPVEESPPFSMAVLSTPLGRDGFFVVWRAVMKRCWRCRSSIRVALHHIKGNVEYKNPSDVISLCPKCHDLIQGICDKCADQIVCHVKKLQRCWAFDDALPPIYFLEKPFFTSKDPLPTPCLEESTPQTSDFRANKTIHAYCLICQKPIFDNANEEYSIICANCVIIFYAHPRKKYAETVESLEDWMERMKPFLPKNL